MFNFWMKWEFVRVVKQMLTLVPFVIIGIFAHADSLAPALPYTKDVTFIVHNGDTTAGIHRLTFHNTGKQLEVITQTRATLNLLGLFKVPFIYDSRALWEGNTLITLSSSFSRGGKPRIFRVYKDGALYRTNQEETAAMLMPTNHWNIAVLQQTVLFNTLNGNLNSVRIVPEGEEMLTINGQQTKALRYRIEGDLDIVLWYDTNDKWLQLQFAVLGSDYIFTYSPNAESKLRNDNDT